MGKLVLQASPSSFACNGLVSGLATVTVLISLAAAVYLTTN